MELLVLQSLKWLWAFERGIYFDHVNHKRYGQLTCRKDRNGVSNFSVLFLPNYKGQSHLRLISEFWDYLMGIWVANCLLLWNLTKATSAKKKMVRFEYHAAKEIKFQSKQFSLILSIYFLKQNWFKILSLLKLNQCQSVQVVIM